MTSHFYKFNVIYDSRKETPSEKSNCVLNVKDTKNRPKKKNLF